jgi:hypothetical protein
MSSFFDYENCDIMVTWVGGFAPPVNISLQTIDTGSCDVDVTAPIVTIVNPANDTLSTTVNFNVTLDETGDWCGYSLDGNANVTMTDNGGDAWGAINSSMAVGTHNVEYFCNDTTGNMNATVPIRYFTVAADTCTCPASGDWEVDFGDNCIISSPCDMQGNDIIITDQTTDGTFTVNAKIYNFGKLNAKGSVLSKIKCVGACFSG